MPPRSPRLPRNSPHNRKLAPQPPARKIFIIRNAVRDLEEFRLLAASAARLKPFGEVQVDIGILADKGWHDVPPGGSPWHEFGTYNSAAFKFFPNPKIAPHLPAQWVAENRKLLLAKAAILRQHGLSAAFTSNETNYLPESFFRDNPELRGPRVDHPRRTRAVAFSPCMDRPEMLAMVESMIHELIRNVPEIKTIFAQNNDSGAGLCWASGQYSGPNGPEFCRNRTTGIRLKALLEAMQRGASTAGGAITVRLAGTFDEIEEREFTPLLPKDTFLSRPYTRRAPPEGDPNIVWTGTMIHDAYPVLGLLDVEQLVSRLELTHNTPVRTVVLTVGQPWYYRGNEPPATVGKLIDIVEAYYSKPFVGPVARRQFLESLAARWGGENNRHTLADALAAVGSAFRTKHEAVPGFDFYYFEGYLPASSRFFTRPMLIRPEALSKEEESYFLPYVFAVHESVARTDYQDAYETRLMGPPVWDYPILRAALKEAITAAEALESLQGAPEQAWLRDLALSVRMWASGVRSINNFYFAQEIRNRHLPELAGPVRVHPMASDAGDPDNLRWLQIQRNEFDNANELFALLRNDGLKHFSRAQDQKHADTFLMGPDVIPEIQKKVDLMRRHWRDIDIYLTPGRK
ncbi:MAG: hypothetical protein HZB13_02220 [Acidobacteria bacterium]|nr:hypothetical protein [Acidobacteriota bacterium]